MMDFTSILFVHVLLLGDFAAHGETDLSDEDKKALLQAHNYYRSLVAEDAANMERMVWNEELASLAQQHADKCRVVNNEDMNIGGLAIGFHLVGENQAISSSLAIDYHSLVGKWYEERKHYLYESKACATEQNCHRYLQLVRALTTDVGCAIKWCTHAVPSVTLLVCHYGPGMVAGELPYQKGPPCSACKSEHHVCSNNLCTTFTREQNGETLNMVPVPHFIIDLSPSDAEVCYKVQAIKGLAYNILDSEQLDMTGVFTHYKNEVHSSQSLVLLDSVILEIKVKDSELPKKVELSRNKQEIRVDNFALPVRKAQSVKITGKHLVVIPSKHNHHTEIFVMFEKIGLQFTARFQNYQLQLFISQVDLSHTNEDAISGLVGQFFQKETIIDKDANMLTLQGFDPIPIEQTTLTCSSWKCNSCYYIVSKSECEDVENRHILKGQH